MKNTSFELRVDLFGPEPPFVLAPLHKAPWTWTVTDSQGREVATAKTRTGGRLALRQLYSQAS